MMYTIFIYISLIAQMMVILLLMMLVRRLNHVTLSVSRRFVDTVKAVSQVFLWVSVILVLISHSMYGIAVAIGILNIFFMFKSISTLGLLDFIVLSVSKKRHAYVHVGFFYVSVRIRDTIVFGFRGLKARITVLHINEDTRLSTTKRPILRYMKGRIGKKFTFGGIVMKVVRGTVRFYDPKKKEWYVYSGSFPVFMLSVREVGHHEFQSASHSSSQ